MTREWSWLKGGVALGLLSAFAFITYKPLGVSTSYPRAVALLLNPIATEFVAENAYFQRVPPVVDWQLMLVLGIVVGGFLASRVVARSTAKERERSDTTPHDPKVLCVTETAAGTEGPSGTARASAGTVGPVEESRGGACGLDTGDAQAEKSAGRQVLRIPPRQWRAFLGGFLVLFGARLADGCTSGHVITGMTQLATASFLFAAAVFAVGIPAAKWLRTKGWS